MQSLVDYFEQFPSSYRTMLLVAGLVVFWIMEGAIPLVSVDYRRTRHAALNLTLTLLQIAVALSLGFLVVATSQYMTARQWGLLHVVQLPTTIQVLGGILLLDFFGGYLIHWIEHKLPWMWRFHIVHHADQMVDVTTGLRHHPIETLFRVSAQLAAVFVGGIPIGIVFMYNILSVFFAQLTHANIRPPATIDRLLSWVFVTPNMHKVHHHEQQPLTDTNYGNVFSIWDRIFGTFVEVRPEELRYGIDSWPSPDEHNHLGSLLVRPFRNASSRRRKP